MELRLIPTAIVVGLLFQVLSIDALSRKPEKDARLVEDAKLVVALKSDKVLLRSTRGSDNTAGMPTDAHSTLAAAPSPKSSGANPAEEKRTRNSGHNNKKLNRNPESHPAANRRKSHMDKQLLSGDDEPQQQSHQHSSKRQQLANRQQHGSSKGNKQRQLLKAQQHQGHQGGKRNGQKANAESADHEINGSKTQSTCRYTKSPWSDCDPKTNTHSRTLVLKKGDSGCLPKRTIEKRCRRACRYEKGAWSECKDGQTFRVDKLKTSSDSSTTTTTSECEASRTISKKCNPDGSNGKSPKTGNGRGNKKERKSKDKAANRGAQST